MFQFVATDITMSLRSIVLLSFLFCMLQAGHFVGSVSCAVEESIRLDQDSGRNADSKIYYLLQVCLLEEWSYVCSYKFDNNDLSVALHQLGSTHGYYTGGGYLPRTRGNKSPAFLTQLQCTGVETKLTNCQRGAKLKKYTCGNIIEVYTNNVPRPCENGELKTTNNVLRICVNAVWKTLCPMLWGPPQAIVACRQLNPGKLIIGSVTKAVVGTPSFKYHFFCNGDEKQITDCVIGDYAVDANICGNSKVTALMCQISYSNNLTLRAVSSSSVEVNWTQPVSVPTPQYRVSHHSITCTSSHGVYTTTSQHVTTPAVNENTHIHMIISGLTASTSYNCCVSAHSELGTSESVCDNVTTTEIEVQPPEHVVSSVLIVSTVVQSTADVRATPHIVQAIDKQAVSTAFLVSTVVQVVSSCTVDIGVTSCNAQEQALSSTTSRPSSAKQSDGTPLPWVGGVIIGAVLSTVMLITVLATVCLWRRKRSHSQHKLPDKNVRERSVSLSHTNDIYNGYSGTPQPYEEYQSKQLQNEPEYSYATHAVETNTYDSVPQQSSSGDDDGCNTEGLTVVDNTALYSMCAGEDVQENGVYSKLNRK